jgi:N-acetylmuramoyl-L-alanine amidase
VDTDLHALYSGPGGDMVFGFRDVVECNRFTQPGDSGALVLNRHGRAVGLHFHGADHSVFCRMVHVLDALEAELGLALELETEERDVDLVGLASGAQPLPLPLPVPTAGQQDAVDILARTLWGEARGELVKVGVGVRAYEAIAEVVINRTTRRQGDGRPWWWGGDVVSVCRKPFQFSCWNANDPNLPKLVAVGPEDHAFRVARNVAARFVDSGATNHTGGATHYYSVAISEPDWARKGQFTAAARCTGG